VPSFLIGTPTAIQTSKTSVHTQTLDTLDVPTGQTIDPAIQKAMTKLSDDLTSAAIAKMDAAGTGLTEKLTEQHAKTIIELASESTNRLETVKETTVRAILESTDKLAIGCRDNILFLRTAGNNTVESFGNSMKQINVTLTDSTTALKTQVDNAEALLSYLVSASTTAVGAGAASASSAASSATSKGKKGKHLSCVLEEAYDLSWLFDGFVVFQLIGSLLCLVCLAYVIRAAYQKIIIILG